MEESKSITKRMVREHLGHNGMECTVRIKRNGEIHRYGSPDPFDRSMDYWQYMGTVIDIAREIAESNDWTKFCIEFKH